MTARFVRTVQRLAAFAVDWLVVVLWGGVLFGVVMIVTAGEPGRPRSPWTGQALGFLSMTLPVLLYFAFGEVSAAQASLGKRALRLVVVDASRRRLSLPKALLRNAIKFVPWEAGHMVAQQAMFAGEAGPPAWVWGACAVAMGVPLWWSVALLRTGATPYDRWTATQVVQASGHGR
ncbi:MAG: RDD family protein [Planctomycetes bacterium]|nr:RDD family protein [Planctomycetota bacterium]